MKRIVFVHTLNNYSGSPNVLSIIIKEFVKKDYDVEIITSKGDGFLSNISNVKYSYTSYRWVDSKFITFLFLVLSWVQTFFKILFSNNSNAIFYINTITPIGAVWACKITGKIMVYHVHENMLQHKPLYGIYRNTYKYCNEKSIFVSDYLQNLSIGKKKGAVVYNFLNSDFTETVKRFLISGCKKGNSIIIISSLRRFKGIYVFIELARKLPNYQFEMVFSASASEVDSFRNEINAPVNVIMHSVQSNLHPFYQNAKILLNLSLPNLWIETFGLTILEAMAYGIPSIVPNIGGPLELVDDGINGFTLDPLNIEVLVDRVRSLMEDDDLYFRFSNAALVKSKMFDLDVMIDKIIAFIND